MKNINAISNFIHHHQVLIKNPRCNCKNTSECALNGKCQNNVITRQLLQLHMTQQQKRLSISAWPSTRSKKDTELCKIPEYNRKYSFETELSEYVWNSKNNNYSCNLKWSIIKRAYHTSLVEDDKLKNIRPPSKRCSLHHHSWHERLKILETYV